MAPAVPLIAAAAGYAASYEAGALIGADLLGSTLLASAADHLIGFVVSTAISTIGSRAFAAPKKTVAQAAQSQAVMVQSALETHKIVYGQSRVSGPIVFLCTTNSGPDANGNTVSGTNIFVHFVVALAGHEVDSIGDIYFNDQPITLNNAGFVSSYPYTQTTTGVDLNAQVAISTAVRTSEVVTVTTAANHGFTNGDKVIIASVTPDGAMNGAFIIQSVPTSTTFTYNNGGPDSSAAGGTATDATAASTTLSLARIIKHTGSDGQQADPQMIAEVPGWDSFHRLQGIAYVYVRMQYDQAVFSAGVPNVSAVVNGKQVYDPRNSTTAWSDNVALCVRDYLTSDYGFNCQTAEINDTYFEAAANHCDESVTLSTGGSQNRYTANGVIDTGVAPIENLNALVAAMAGTVTYVQGQFRAYAGVYDSTVGDLTTDMLAGPVKVHTRTTRHELFNAVQGTYTDPNLNWQATDFFPITNATYQADDGGQAIYKDIQLPFTNHPEAAQRIATLLLNQARQAITIELPLKHMALQYAVWDTVTYTDPNLGWNQMVFRIKTLSSSGIGPITLGLQQESSASYDWTSANATTVSPAPDTNLPNPFIVNAPNGVAFNSRAVAATGGTTVYNLSLLWNPIMDTFVVHGGRLEIQYKLHTDTNWRPSFYVSGNLTVADILSSSINTSYDLRIRAVNSLGVPSNWVEIDNAVVGSSGGVGTTNDWDNYHDSVGTSNDWTNWTNAVGTTADWGAFT